jgi:cytochrome oxidase Cu insertion factor (SCO1/SenC/PrrC family)
MRLSLLILAAVAVACAQLGPKDGGELAPSDPDRIQIGQKAPDFTLKNADGQAVSLSSYRGKNVVLVFYRGYW